MFRAHQVSDSRMSDLLPRFKIFGAAIGFFCVQVVISASAATPVAPTNLAAVAASSSQVNLSWSDNSSDETGFKLQRSTNGTSFSLVATLGANATTYANSGLAGSTKYYYRLRAYNSAGGSKFSNVVNVT